jgi:gamma-glutamylcyclotransferase (GGCT)/AIG2-like uncharacterized protein YtfP
MLQRLILFLILTLCLNGAEESMLLGQWNSTTYALNNGTQTKEKEYLKFYPDHTFDLLFLVTLEKGNSFVKDLRIEGKGIWKTRGNILVVVIKDIEVPVAGEIYGISQSSLKEIAALFHNRFKNDPIRILVIKSLEAHTLVTENKRKQRVTYQR